MGNQTDPENAGEVFGWVDRGIITTLVLMHAQGVPGHPEPGGSVLPHLGVARSAWPPFTGEPLGPWLGEHIRSGRLVCLDDLIGSTQELVYWAPSGRPGEGVIAVEIPLPPEPVTWTLPAGIYAYHRAITEGLPIPQLSRALRDPRRVDLGRHLAVTAAKAS